MSAISNINGTNVSRLNVVQLGSGATSCVLQFPLVKDSDSKEYTVSLEKFELSTDIPILPKNTHVFTLYDTELNNLDENDNLNNLDYIQCSIGPVYSFIDFCQQIQEWSTTNMAGINISAIHASQKKFALHASEMVWRTQFMVFSDEVGKILDIPGGPGYYHYYLRRHDAFEGGSPDLLKLDNNGNIVFNQDSVEVMYHDETDQFEEEYGARDTLVRVLPMRLGQFDTRSAIRIDSVLPLPKETFSVSSSATDYKEASMRYNFVEMEFPREKVSHKTHTVNNRISDVYRLVQELQSGCIRIKDNHNSMGKVLLAGQLQDHRYELFLVRRSYDTQQRKIVFKEEPLELSSGDYFRLSLVFAKQIK